MIKRWTSFFKANVKMGLWISLYLGVQCLVMLGYMIYYIYTDYDFSLKFLDIFEPIVDMPFSYEKNLKSYEGLIKLFQGRMGVILLVSAVLVVFFCGLYWYKTHSEVKYHLNGMEIFGLVVLAMTINLVISIIVELLPVGLTNVHDELTGLAVSNGFVVDAVTTGILVPIEEELLFRYCLLKPLLKVNVKYAILYQALLFGLLHGNLIQGIYGFMLGVFFGILFYRNNSLVPSIVLHITINLGSVIAVYLFKDDIMGLFIMLLVSSLIYFVHRFAFSTRKL